ncbi:hypothetical protein HWV62_7960 [Athelia sp. TMB]|nr:hypothetical protein HWV62_7960 [Athelia sp. TMB]
MGALEKKSPSPRQDYFFVLYEDGKELLRSNKVPRSALKWTVEKPPITVYRLTPTGQRRSLRTFLVAELQVRSVDLLDKDMKHELANEAGEKIPLRIVVQLDAGIHSRAAFMKSVDKEVTRLAKVRSAGNAQSVPTVGETIGIVLQKIVSIVDAFAKNDHVLNLAWIALSCTYEAVQKHVVGGGALGKLAERLCEMVGAASGHTNLFLIEDAVDVIEKIGRTALDVAVLIHQHADPAIKSKTSSVAACGEKTYSLSDMSAQIAACEARCVDLTTKISSRLQSSERVTDSHQMIEISPMVCKPNHVLLRTLNVPQGPTFNAIGTSGKVTMVAGSNFIIGGDYNVVQEGARELQDGLNEVQDGVTDIKDGLKGIKDDQKKEKIERWLVAPDTSLNYKAARDKHQRGTGSWLVDGADFIRWKHDSDSVLWLRGGRELFILGRFCHTYYVHLSWMRQDDFVVGFIHTVSEHRFIWCRSSSAIEDVKNSYKGKLSVGYAYFFFDGTSAQSKLAAHESLVRSCIMQFSDRFDGIPPALVKLYEDEDNGRSQPALSSLEDTLLQILQSFGAAYIVIDALDECDDRPKLLRWIDSIVLQMPGLLHLMVASRPEPDIKDRLRALCNLREVDVADRRGSDDIRRYIDASLSEVHAWTDSQKELVRIALVNGAHGVFRWVVLMIHQLISDQCLSTSELKIRLRSLPKGLDEAYTKIIQQSTRRTDVIRFLQWIIFGNQDFSARELAEVAAINFDAGGDTLPFYDPDRRYGSPDSVLRACSGLVIEVQGMNALSQILQTLAYIKIAHFSVKEFLLLKIIQLEPTRSIRCNESLSHQAIAKTCLAYLLHFGELDSITVENIESFPLAFYAAKQCVFHVESICGEDLDATLEKMIQQLASPIVSCALINWSRLESNCVYFKGLTLENRIELWDVTPALYAAIIIPLKRLVNHLIKNGKRGIALHVTSDLGSLAIAQLLLEKGADANATGGKYGTALQAASVRGSLEIVKLLLEKGADANATGGEYGTALQAASRRGHLEIARLLLEKGADVDATGGQYGTALQAASYGEKLQMVRLLLGRGADVNAMGGEYGTALQAASYGEEIEIVRLLLGRGADINATGGEYGTALQAAAYGGECATVKLLLEKGAEVNAMGGKCGSALQAARGTRGSREAVEIVQLLKEHGALEMEPDVEWDNA